MNTPVIIAREKCFDCVRYRPRRGSWSCEFFLQPVFVESEEGKIKSINSICRGFLEYGPRMSWGRKYLELSEKLHWPLWMRGIVRFIAKHQRRVYVESPMEKAAMQIVGKK